MNGPKDHDLLRTGAPSGDAQCTMRGNVLVARMTGEIDLSNAEQVGGKVAQATPDHALGVVLDLTEVLYLDSAGLFVINGLRRRLADQGQSLILVVPEDRQVRRTLEVVELQRFIPIADTVEDAIGALAQSAS